MKDHPAKKNLIVDRLREYASWRLAAHQSECDDPLWPKPVDIALAEDAAAEIERLEERDIRNAALEEAAKMLECQSQDCVDVFIASTLEEAADDIRALKAEGESR